MQAPTMLARFVFWKDDGDFPLFRTVPVTPGFSVALTDMSWLVEACDDLLFTALEVYNVQRAMWRVKTLEKGRLKDLETYPTTLIRVAGVEDCPLFGLELENIYRGLGWPAISPNIPEEDSRIDTCMRPLRVVVWRENGEDPIVHIINFSSDNWVRLDDFNSLYVDLDVRCNVLRYYPDEQDWHLQTIMCGFYVEPEYDTILLKFTEVTITIGFGHEVEQFAKLYQPQEGFGEGWYPAGYETNHNLAKAICGALDVMTTIPFDFRPCTTTTQTPSTPEPEGVIAGDGESTRLMVDTECDEMGRVDDVALLANSGAGGLKRPQPDESGSEDSSPRVRRARYE